MAQAHEGPMYHPITHPDMALPSFPLDAAVIDAEREVDTAFAAHPLFRLPNGDAIVLFLTAAQRRLEDMIEAELRRGGITPMSELESSELFVDRLFEATWQVTQRTWRPEVERRAVPQVAALARDSHASGLAASAVQAALTYVPWVYAYTSARRVGLPLNADGATVRAEPSKERFVYRAYNQLTRVCSRSEPSAAPGLPDAADAPLEEYVAAVKETVRSAFRLPLSAALGAYTLGDAAGVWGVLVGLALRQIAAGRTGRVPHGSPLLVSPAELVREIVAHGGVAAEAAAALVAHLTLGGAGIRRAPDPGIQPLIPVGERTLALAPFLVIHNAFERSLFRLLNLQDSNDPAVQALKNAKESILRERFSAQIARDHPGRFSVVSRQVGFGNIDAAVLDHESRSALLVELKWFFDPAAAHEVVYRNEELMEGARQMRALLDDAALGRSSAVRRALDIPAAYAVAGVVATPGWAGDTHTSADVSEGQRRWMPVLNADHLAARLRRFAPREVGAWAYAGQHLPTEADIAPARVRYQFEDRYLLWWGVNLKRAASATSVGQDFAWSPVVS